MVFLICRYLGDDVGGGLVELVKVVLLGRRFLEMVNSNCATLDTNNTYQHCCLVRSDHLGLAVAAYKGVPDLVAPGRFVFLYDDEQRTVPPRHTVRLFVPEDEVLEVLLFIAPILVLVSQQGGVDLATFISGGAYVHL